MKTLLVISMLRLLHLRHPTNQQLTALRQLSEVNVQVGQQYKVDPLLITVVQYRESKFKQYAVSNDHKDVGRMQIRKSGAAEGYGFTRQQLFDPRVNTLLGVRYLRRQIDRCGGVTRGLAAYNKGHCTNQLRYGRETMALYKALLKMPTVVAWKS